MGHNMLLRPVEPSDLDVFFENQRDPEACQMVAFTSRDPNDRAAYNEHMERVLANEEGCIQTVVVDGKVAGSVLKYMMEGRPELGYWFGRNYWGKGVATQAVGMFIEALGIRPLYAHVAKDNVGSIRVLEKNGFKLIEEGMFYSNARGMDVPEVILELA